MASGASKVIEVKDFVVPEGAADPFVNTAKVTCSPAGFPNIYTDEASWSTTCSSPPINLTKTGDASSKIGDKVNYKITLANNSSTDTPVLTCTVTDAGGRELTFEVASVPITVIKVKDFVSPGSAADPFVNTAKVTCSPAGFPNVHRKYSPSWS